jgi:hypothetical protein
VEYLHNEGLTLLLAVSDFQPRLCAVLPEMLCYDMLELLDLSLWKR